LNQPAAAGNGIDETGEQGGTKEQDNIKPTHICALFTYAEAREDLTKQII
jgi:hypothetical protein